MLRMNGSQGHEDSVFCGVALTTLPLLVSQGAVDDSALKTLSYRPKEFRLLR